MILVIGGIKGGSGKTTIATNLCQLRASQGFKVLLVDADEQKSAYDWSLQRDHNGYGFNNLTMGGGKSFVTVCMSGKAVYSNLVKMRSDYDDIIVDTGGRDTTSQRAALCDADKFLMPFKPSSVDIWTMGGVKRMIDECVNSRLKSYAVISQADPKGKDNEEALNTMTLSV
jgi:chromosome partitioning protein